MDEARAHVLDPKKDLPKVPEYWKQVMKGQEKKPASV